MTQVNRNSFFAFASAAAVMGIAMIAQTGTANAKNVLSCDGSDRRSVVECCESVVRKKGEPFWMVQTGRHCSGVVKCVGGGGGSSLTHATVAKRRCWVYNEIELDGGRDKKRGGGKDRGRQTSSRGGKY